MLLPLGALPAADDRVMQLGVRDQFLVNSILLLGFEVYFTHSQHCFFGKDEMDEFRLSRDDFDEAEIVIVEGLA